MPYIFHQKGFCECVVLGKRLPLNHLTMLCCHVAYLEKKKSIFCGSLWCCEFSFQVAFISSCRRKRRFKKCIVLPFHCYTMFIFFNQSDGGCVTLFTLAITIKESLAGGNGNCSICVRVMICVSNFVFNGTKRPDFQLRNHEMVIVWSITFGISKQVNLKSVDKLVFTLFSQLRNHI